jgi:very-short-patch-repair endonuclease
VVSAEQLKGLGLSRGKIRGLVRIGLLHQLHCDVFVYGHPKPTSRGRLRAALLTCGPHSFLSHRTAAALWGLRSLNPFRLEVTVPDAKRRNRDGLTIHRTTANPSVTARVGLRVSSFVQTVLDLAPTETPKELDRLITEGIRKGVLRPDELNHAIDHSPRRPGVAKLAQVFMAYRPTHKATSDLERTMAALIADSDLPPPERNVKVEGWELDFYWPEFGVAVETDGRPYHIAVRDQEKDKYKDTKLALMGITVIRITDARLGLEPDKVLADIRALLILHGFQAG